MRSLSASARRAVFCASIVLFAGCASHGPPVPPREPVVALEGEIALSGSTSDSRIILSDDGGAICQLAGGPLELELRGLAGLGVRVTGRLAGKTDGLPEFLVDRYELLPVGAHEPIVGLIESNGATVRIVDARGGSYRLDGPLAKALAPFAGYKAWVAGRARETGEGRAREVLIEVGSYGVLLPPGSVTRSP